MEQHGKTVFSLLSSLAREQQAATRLVAEACVHAAGRDAYAEPFRAIRERMNRGYDACVTLLCTAFLLPLDREDLVSLLWRFRLLFGKTEAVARCRTVCDVRVCPAGILLLCDATEQAGTLLVRWTDELPSCRKSAAFRGLLDASTAWADAYFLSEADLSVTWQNGSVRALCLGLRECVSGFLSLYEQMICIFMKNL